MGPQATLRRETVLDSVGLEAHADHLALVGRVRSHDLDPCEIRYRVHDPVLADRLDVSATPFWPVLLLLAGATATDLVVDAPVDASALDQAESVAVVLRDWWGWRAPSVDAVREARGRAPADGVGLWFTRGVDSCDTLLRSMAGELHDAGADLTVTHLLGLDWIDAPYASPHGPGIWADTVEVAADLGLPLIRTTTDVRRALEPIVGWKYSHGCVFAGLGLLLGPLLGTVVISASAVGDRSLPLGSHPQLDPLFSTASTRIVHTGRVPRSAKIPRIVTSDWALAALKVCWQVDSTRNCGRCAKCLATMTLLYDAGVLDRCDRFDGDLTAEAVRAVARAAEPIALGPHSTRDTVLVARRVSPELRDAWREVEVRVAAESRVARP